MYKPNNRASVATLLCISCLVTILVQSAVVHADACSMSNVTRNEVITNRGNGQTLTCWQDGSLIFRQQVLESSATTTITQIVFKVGGEDDPPAVLFDLHGAVCFLGPAPHTSDAKVRKWPY